MIPDVMFSRCLDHCTESGYLYAGVQYGLECFCGNERPGERARLADSRCDKLCPGDSDARCGGYLTMNVYQGSTHMRPPQEFRVTELLLV